MSLKLKFYRGLMWVNNFGFNIGVISTVILILAWVFDFQLELSGGSPLFAVFIFLTFCFLTGLFRHLSNEITRSDEYKRALVSLFENAYKKTLIVLIIIIYSVEQYTASQVSIIESLAGATVLSFVLVNYVFIVFSVFNSVFESVIELLHSDYASFQRIIKDS